VIDLDAIFGPEKPAAGSVPSVQPDAAAWDEARADAVRADALGRLDGVLTRRATTEARRTVLGHYRGLVLGYHARQDPMLWQVIAGLELLYARWKE
jgi:hypothetical protein